jgi:hypothetical protein
MCACLLSPHYSTQLSSIMNGPERFNSKARKSSATASSHKRGKQRRLKGQPAADTNLEVVQRKSTEEKELNRREQLKEEVRVNSLHTTSISLVVVTRAVSIKSVKQEEEEVG